MDIATAMPLASDPASRSFSTATLSVTPNNTPNHTLVSIRESPDVDILLVDWQVLQTVVSSHHRYRRMSDKLSADREPGQPPAYQIRIKGHLGRQWTDWFAGLTITLEDNGDTLLTGPVADQAALHGLLKKVRDLGTPLISVNRVQPDRADTPDGK